MLFLCYLLFITDCGNGEDTNGEIEFPISSINDNFMDEFYRGMYIFILDGFSRQFYLQSDYSNGEEQPVIIFYDEEGSVITENNDFIEIDLDEE